MLEIDAILSIYPDGKAEIESDDFGWGPWPVTLEEVSDAGLEITKTALDSFLRVVVNQQYVAICFVRVAAVQREDGWPQFISIIKRNR